MWVWINGVSYLAAGSLSSLLSRGSAAPINTGHFLDFRLQTLDCRLRISNLKKHRAGEKRLGEVAVDGNYK